MFNFLKGKKFPLTDFLPHPTIFLLSFTSLFPSLSLFFHLPFPSLSSLFPSLVPSSPSLPFFPTFYFLHYIPRDVPTILRKSTVVWVETWGFPPGAGNGKWGGGRIAEIWGGGVASPCLPSCPSPLRAPPRPVSAASLLYSSDRT